MLHDNHGREFPYLRLSITDVCNFRCSYCLPDGYQCHEHADYLRVDEIVRLVRAFADLGMWKVRLTGGEPSTRADLPDIARAIAAIPGIKRLAITTNGWRLHKDIALWREVGINALNISIDSLDAQVFARITGHDRLHDLLLAVDRALELSFEQVKVNAVMLRDVNDQELDSFLSWIATRPISLRFIELMQTGDNAEFFRRHHYRAESLIAALRLRGWSERERVAGSGPAREFAHPDSLGRVGIIAPYARDFCTTCNRLRVTAFGALRLCLFGDAGVDLRDLLQSDQQLPALQQRIQTQLGYKKAGHYLHDGDTGATRHLAMVGG